MTGVRSVLAVSLGRRLLPLAVIAALVWWLGTGPFLHGLRQVDAASVSVGVGVGLVTTVAAAWRWQVIAAGHGLRLRLPSAVAAYYRSQFLNSVLPAGVLGDVHRAVDSGRDSGSVGDAARAVVWDRVAGQLVQVGLAVPLVLLAPRGLPVPPPAIAALLAIGLLVAFAVVGVAARRGRTVLLRREVWPVAVLTSLVVCIGHLTTFLYAAHRAGVPLSEMRLIPVAVLCLLAMSVPLGIGGWGPREGVTAWLFTLAGWDAALGLSTSTIYGVMSICGCLPGAAVLLAGRFPGRRPSAAVNREIVARPVGEVVHG